MSSPFELVYDTLIDGAQADTTLAALQQNNIIDFTSGRAPYKERIASGDVPELALLSNNVIGTGFQATSCAVDIGKAYVWVLVTGEQNISEYLYKLQWALFRAMIRTSKSIGTLTWNGQRFVKDLDFQGGPEDLGNTDLNRAIRGWSSLWTINVRMRFNINEVIGET